LIILLAVLVAVGILTGCGGGSNPPDELVSKVEGEMENMQRQRLDRYLPEVYAAVTDSFEAALTEISELQEQTSGGGSYEHAERLLVFADSALIWADDTVAVLKEYYERRVDSLRTAAESLLDAVIAVSEDLQPSLAEDTKYQEIRRRIVNFRMQLAQGNTQYKTGVLSDAGLNYAGVARGAEEAMRELENLR
jgi:hypothetical protein